MSWQLLSFLVVVAVVLAGFGWYERSRPPSQVVALVAALAALAIAGRVAFAALPNVKPTTDIVVFAGYALGPAPGFAVGALSALVSNFWFGQGPWTPWQMAGWGLCGILGAALVLLPRPLGRWSLATVCAAAALGYGALQNFSLMATYGGDLSWRHFWVLEGRAVPFEIAHAAGNVVLALIAGPAMVRMLVRFRRRFEWERRGAGSPAPVAIPSRIPSETRHAGGLVAVLAVLLLAGGVLVARAESATPDPAAGAAWLAAQQNPDGGWGSSPGEDSGQEMTGWAMLGLEAAGRNPLDVAQGGRSAVDFLRAEVGTVTASGDLARTILALEGAGVDPRDFGGRDLVAALVAKRRGDGSWGGSPPLTAYSLLALEAAGAGGRRASAGWLRLAQGEDGGWGDTAATPSNADSTGAVLQALSPTSKASDRGVAYLRSTQQRGGGWRLGENGALNSQSTAWAAEGLLAAGVEEASVRRGGASPLDYLSSHQAADGHYAYSGSSDQTPIWVTGQALVAASGRHLPIATLARAARPAAPRNARNAGAANQGPASGTAAGKPAPDRGRGQGAGGPTRPRDSTGGHDRGASSAGGRAAPRGSTGAARGRTGGLAPAPRASSSPEGSGASRAPSAAPDGGARPRGSERTIAPSVAQDHSLLRQARIDDRADSSSSTSIASSILAGLLAGCLLFGAGWAAYSLARRRRARRLAG